MGFREGAESETGRASTVPTPKRPELLEKSAGEAPDATIETSKRSIKSILSKSRND